MAAEVFCSSGEIGVVHFVKAHLANNSSNPYPDICAGYMNTDS